MLHNEMQQQKKDVITWGCRGELCISILFLFPLLFLMGGASAPPGGSNMQAEAGWIQLRYEEFSGSQVQILLSAP